MHSAFVRAWRSWAAAPGVALLAIVALAIGIGSATAIYAVIDTVVLRPFTYWDVNRYFALYAGSLSAPERRASHTFGNLIEYQQRTRSFDVFGWLKPGNYTMTYAGEPQYIAGAEVTPSLAAGLAVRPALGTWFSDDATVVLADGLWRRLGANPAIVGQPLTLDGRTFTIAGVMPPDFRLPVYGPGVDSLKPELWIRLDPLGKGQDPTLGMNFCYVRLKPGVTPAQARDDVKRAAAEIAALNSGLRSDYTAVLDGIGAASILGIRPVLILTSVAAGLLLLLTCADVSGLVLARAVSRQRETAIRVALGARRGQLALHYFFEGLLVALAGTALGALVSLALVRVVLSIAADFVPRADEISFDGRVLLFSIGLAFITSAAASLAPLWQAGRTAPVDVLNQGVRSTAGARSRRLSQSLVVAEIALAFMLLTIGAVLLAHMMRLGGTAPGFNPDNLLTFRLTRTERPGMSRAARQQDQERFTSALAQIPGVSSVGLANQLPLAGCCFTTSVFPDGVDLGPSFEQRISFLAVSPQYLTTMQVPLRAGRVLDARDLGEDPIAVMINEAAVRTYWHGANALDAFGRLGATNGSRFQVVGIVGDIRNDGLGQPPIPEIYISNAFITLNPLRFVVRSALPPSTLAGEIRRAIRAVDPAQPIHAVATMHDIASESLSLPRVASVLTAFFALAALVMATLGVYGVVSYAVRQDTTELGTRMALGALDRELVGSVVRGGLKLAAVGIAIGAIAAVASTSLVVRVFDVDRIGALPFVASAAIVAVVTFVASFVPAWRVTALSPMVAIRSEPGARWRSTRTSLAEALRGVSHAFTPAREPGPALDENVLTDFVAAARSARSYGDAFQLALATLASRLGASTALLLENREGEFRPIARAPQAPHGAGGTRPEAGSDPVPDAPRFPVGGFLHSRVRSYSHALPLQPGDLDSWIRWAAEARPAHLPELQALQQIGARLVVALRTADELLGMLILGAPLDRERYSHAERTLLRQCGEQLTLMIENARLTSRVVEQEKLRRDLALASEVQRRLLPAQPPDYDFAAISAYSAPARSVGGDYYDFLDLGEHRVGIALADVAGKGVAAALIMAVVQASLRIVAADQGTSLPALAAKINDYLHRSTLSKSYATFFYAQLDQATRELRYVNAGHNPPYLVRRGGDASSVDGIEIKELNVGGMVLGLFPELAYEEAAVALQRGDVLIAFTDGVTEALNAAEEEFGEDRLKEVIRGSLHLAAAEISARLSEALRLWIRDTAQYDDLTFVVIKVN